MLRAGIKEKEGAVEVEGGGDMGVGLEDVVGGDHMGEGGISVDIGGAEEGEGETIRIKANGAC